MLLEQARRLVLAPMMGITHRHCRYFFRCLSKEALLFTEMLTPQAILRGSFARLMAFDPRESPVALQLGGRDAVALSLAAETAFHLGYDEINLNIGCPSSRVSDGGFGACLMKEPDCVAKAVASISERVPLPVTVKTRLGVDDHDNEDFLRSFIEIVAEAGCRVFYLHARKAWLKGLNPTQNRTVPKLNYERVYAIKRAYPELTIILNGGLDPLKEVEHCLGEVDGMMIGRAAIEDPMGWMELSARVFNTLALTRQEVLQKYTEYLEAHSSFVPSLEMWQPLIHLFQGTQKARQWRRLIHGCMQEKAGVERVTDLLSVLRSLHP